MRRQAILYMVAITALVLFSVPSWANDPVKWSAPMSHYPTQWAPTAEPPRWHNPYGYRYPYYGYGYGPYDSYGYGSYGSWGQAGHNQAYQTAPRQGYSGNPYSYYYGR